jgi:hypothetical protein
MRNPSNFRRHSVTFSRLGLIVPGSGECGYKDGIGTQQSSEFELMVRRSQIAETKFIKWLFLSVSALAILFAPDSAVSIWFKRASDTGVDVNTDKKKPENRNTKHTPLSFVGRRREELIRTSSNFAEIKLRFSDSGLI